MKLAINKNLRDKIKDEYRNGYYNGMTIKQVISLVLINSVKSFTTAEASNLLNEVQ